MGSAAGPARAYRQQARTRLPDRSASISSAREPRESSPPLGFSGENEQHPKPVARWVAELVDERGDDLGRPQILRLEVYQALGRAQGAQVRLQDPECAARKRRVDALGTGADDLAGDLANGGGRGGLRQPLAGHGPPAEREMAGYVGNEWAVDAGGDVMPAQRGPRRVAG
jgi:hypothetical protein